LNSAIKRLLIVAGAALLLIATGIGGVFLVAGVYRYFHPYFDRTISGPVTITPEWTEIVPKEPLKAERQINNFILVFDTSQLYEPNDNTNGIRFPDGSVVTPEVQLIDQGGRSYTLTSIGVSRNGMVLRYENLPQNISYRMVRIRSDKPIKVSKIYWRCYNQWHVN